MSDKQITEFLPFAEENRRLQMYNDFVVDNRHLIMHLRGLQVNCRSQYNEKKDCYELVIIIDEGPLSHGP